jgi:hypothetical protein
MEEFILCSMVFVVLAFRKFPPVVRNSWVMRPVRDLRSLFIKE